MKKDHIRDYATEAFRFYAKVGGTKKYIKMLTEDIQRQEGPSAGVTSPTEAALMAREKALQRHAAELADLEAVERTLNILSQAPGGKHILQAVEFVYFKDCWRPIRRGEIQERVHYAEIHIPASERQVYRWLRQARDLFAIERGLRL